MLAPGDVMAFSRTVLGYTAGYYYDSGVDATWYANGSTTYQLASTSYGDSEVDFSATGVGGGSYQIAGNHYADAYFWIDEIQTYWDPYCLLQVYDYWYWTYYWDWQVDYSWEYDPSTDTWYLVENWY